MGAGSSKKLKIKATEQLVTEIVSQTDLWRLHLHYSCNDRGRDQPFSVTVAATMS